MSGIVYSAVGKQLENLQVPTTSSGKALLQIMGCGVHCSWGLQHVAPMASHPLDAFLDGLPSMAPAGVWLPWREVVALTQRCGWTPERCELAAENWESLGARMGCVGVHERSAALCVRFAVCGC